MSMIIGTHAAIHSIDAAKDVELLRNVLQLDAVDAGAAVIFRLPLAEVHAHPFEKSGAIEFYLMCRDIEEFVRRMGENGVTCSPAQNVGWGLMTEVTLPGGTSLGVYQPLYPMP
jgi:hypothetical protein